MLPLVIRIRAWKKKDAPQLAAIANNYHIWQNLTDTFPYPYNLSNAEEWINLNTEINPPENLAVVVNGQVAGAVGVFGKTGNYLNTAELGYWIGEPFWGKGVATRAVKLLLSHTFKNFPHIHRIEARVLTHNQASAKVLEKNGFSREGVHKKSFMKEGVLCDTWMYACLRKKP